MYIYIRDLTPNLAGVAVPTRIGRFVWSRFSSQVDFIKRTRKNTIAYRKDLLSATEYLLEEAARALHRGKDH